MRQVFISSTYIDMIVYRKAIWNLLGSYNLQITGMEEFGARTEKPLETCLNEVEESDIFVAVVGMRYGSLDNTTSKSFSQLEYERAKSLNKEILVYILDESSCRVIPEHIDFKNHEKLSKFKSILKQEHTIDSFADEQDLIRKLRKRLKELYSSKIEKGHRPQVIQAKIERFKVNSTDWTVVLGYRFGELFEVYATESEDLLFVPHWLVDAYVIQAGPNEYNLQYKDRDGYKVTIAGLGRVNTSIMVRVISKLLTYNVPIPVVLKLIDDVDFENTDIEIAVKKALKKNLNKTHKKEPG